MLVQIKTIRVDRYTREEYEADAELSIEKEDNGDIAVKMTRGGETGFESFTIARLHTELYGPKEVGNWTACSGRPGEYDKVTVLREEMERAYFEAGISLQPSKETEGRKFVQH